MKNNIVIVGAGPSGVYCALQILKMAFEAHFTDFRLTLFDKAQALRTILPTGNGRCNITNATVDIDEFISNYPRGAKFLYSLFNSHFSYDSIDFFNSIGVKTYVQDDLRVFPVSNSAKSVKDKMLEELKKYSNAKLINKEIKSKKDLEGFSHIIFATGSRVSAEIFSQFGHKILPFKKALCALRVENPIYPEGVSVKSLDGDFIFTKFGVSGPLIFKISSLNVEKSFPYEISINLFSYEQLYDLVLNNPKKSIGNLVSRFIPRSLTKVIVKEFDKNAAEISKEKLKEYSVLNLKIVSNAPEGEIVNAGGINLDELTKCCKSKFNDNVWFCGELLNIDGFCGGFNLQNCWSSAYVVAKDIVCSIIK